MKSILLLSLLPLWAAVAVASASSALSDARVSPAFISTPTRSSQTTFRYSKFDADINNHPDINIFNKAISVTDDTIDMLRGELKVRLLNAADEYSEMRAKTDNLYMRAKEFEDQTTSASDVKAEQRLVPRLLGRIVRKISRRKPKKNEDKTLTQSQGILTSDSFKQMTLDVGEKGEKVIELAKQLSLLNPTPNPTLGFKEYGGVSAKESKLEGQWKLRFTTAADASFAESSSRGVATTSQMIDAEKGTFTNVVDFEKGKLHGFRVVVDGTPLSNTDIQLSFKKVKLLRSSRIPRLFGTVTIRLPSRLIRWLATRNKSDDEKKAPYLSIKYLDDDLRIHTTDSNNWFVQSRIS